MAYESLKMKGFLQKIWHADHKKYGIRTPPLCHMNRFIGGGGGLQLVEHASNSGNGAPRQGTLSNFS